MYSLESKEMTFALTVKGHEKLCGHTLIRTEHPKLIVLETKDGSPFKRKFHIVQNLDLFLYINSKFVYIERHQKKQITQLYRDFVLQRCNKNETIKNALAISINSPEQIGGPNMQIAYNLMKGPGYMAVVSGEVIHLMKCVATEVKIKNGTECYAQLQVERNNETMFLTPRTRILLKRGVQVNCNHLLPSYYKVTRTGN